MTDEFVERARGVTTHNDIYDLEDSHTPDNPRVRRIKLTHKQHPEYGRLVRHPEDPRGAARPVGAATSASTPPS